ncbi:serine/threonine-protein phosphatase [Nocardioides sp. zg-536]|uniref:Serine/threonine-protein phosphatase n=1 Tax=Nocardioides faecalis TaxID=2803858 RepID=A0A938Y7P3_9ACTN|nr:PP2C family protein-serine/threonine phosphatase [Nocardioides faecalis]MBM9459006.1 serine/threonine-protein phosphatase [Nocardioides faecalis]QVI57274.1 serine/threonine-protein phosphatase [Nocardioides faecalis]
MEPLLAELRARLQARGKLPPLPAGWAHQSAMLGAAGVSYGGDFIVTHLDTDHARLHMVLVDVCGHGPAAVPAALQLTGALQSLIVAVPADDLLPAANRYLLRQPSDESLATAVQVDIDLASGDYRIRSAGHPPALRWAGEEHGWSVDNARGMALGVEPDPEVHDSKGRLASGEALLFYTDGVVESRGVDIDEGIEWLRATASSCVRTGWDGVARRIIDLVPRGDDDRAVLVLRRD